MVKILISFEKKHLYFLFFAIGILALAGFGMAFKTNPSNNPSQPAVMGHSSDEVLVNVSGNEKTLQTAIDDGTLGGSWTRNGNNISYTAGNVGIGTPSPSTGLMVTKGNAASLTKGSGMLQIGDDAVSGNQNLVIDWQSIQSRKVDGTAQNLLINPYGGNVGIGVTPGVKLDVSGDVRATRFLVGGNDVGRYTWDGSRILVDGQNVVRSAFADTATDVVNKPSCLWRAEIHRRGDATKDARCPTGYSAVAGGGWGAGASISSSTPYDSNSDGYADGWQISFSRGGDFERNVQVFCCKNINIEPPQVQDWGF
jgi:hypothetical protein